MLKKTDNKRGNIDIEVRKSGTPALGEMAARITIVDGNCGLRGEFYRTHDQYGLRFDFARADDRNEYKELAATMASLYDDFFSGRAVQYQGMDRREPVSTYLNRVFHERTARRRTKLLAAESRAYPTSPRPYTVHINAGRPAGTWYVYAYAERERPYVAQARVDARSRKPKLHSVFGQSTNTIWAEAGAAAIERAWRENAIVLLETDKSSRQQSSSMTRVRMRDHCTKLTAQASAAIESRKARKAA